MIRSELTLPTADAGSLLRLLPPRGCNGNSKGGEAQEEKTTVTVVKEPFIASKYYISLKVQILYLR